MSLADEHVTSGDYERRIADLERSVRRSRRGSTVALIGALVLGVAAWSSRAMSPSPDSVLRVRGLIVEDALGRPRVVLGAPLALTGRTSNNAGVGIAVLSPSGKLRVAVGAPLPAPSVNGKVLDRSGGDAGGGAGGLVFFDTSGDERGGLGSLPNGAANMCLDYARAPKEAICMAVAPNNAYAGVTVNGTPGQGYERAALTVSDSGAAVVKIAARNGDERAILRTTGAGPAQLLVRDSVTHQFVDVLAHLQSMTQKR